MNYNSIDTKDKLNNLLQKKKRIEAVFFQNLDFHHISSDLLEKEFLNCMFYNCIIPEALGKTTSQKNHFYSKEVKSFNNIRGNLYHSRELWEGYSYGLARRKQKHLLQQLNNAYNSQKNLQFKASLQLHDLLMNNSLTSYLSTKDKSKILVIEGGERLSRSSDYYKQLVFLGKSLSKKGFTFISATNSGVSEAIFLGYKLTNTYKTAMMAVLDQLKQAPHTTDRLWLDVAIKATASIPNSENKSILLTTTSNKKVSPYAHKVALFHSKEVLEKQYTLFGHHPILYCNHNQSKTIYQSFKSLKKSKKPSYGLFPEKAENRLIFKDSSRLNWHQFFQEFSLEIDDCQLIIKSIETTKNLIHKLNKLLCSSTL